MAAPPKGKGPASDSIMAAEKMRPLLALSKREPVQAAFGLTSDGEGVLLLDKKAKPKKVLSMLRADAGKAKLQLNTGTLRFGRAEVDTEYDASMVRFFINKEALGPMRAKLIEVVKRAAFQKVEFNVDPSLEAEPEEELDGQDASAASASVAAASPPQAPPPQAPPPQAAPEAGALARELAALARQIAEHPDAAMKARLVKFATDANGAIKAGNLPAASGFIADLRTALNGAAPGGPSPDSGPLVRDLGLLVKRIAEASGADAARRAALMKFATDANGAIKTHDLTAAGGFIGQLRAALDAGGAKAPAAKIDVRAIWRDAKDAVDDGLNRLAAELRTYEDPDLERIADFGLFGLGTGENVALNKALIEFSGGRPGAGEKLRAAVGNYRTMLGKEPMVALIDSNPAVPMSMAATIGGALTQIEQAIV